jgi:hypothetical protein
MNVRQRKRLIQYAGVVVAACSAAVLAGGLVVPVELESARTVPVKSARFGTESRPATESPQSQLRPSLAELRKTCSVDLRRPLFDKPPPEKKPPAGVVSRKPVASANGIRLVGIADEPGHSMAMFQKPDGAIGVCAAGGSIDIKGNPLTVVSIRNRTVTVKYAGSTRRFEILPQPVPGLPPGRGGVRR